MMQLSGEHVAQPKILLPVQLIANDAKPPGFSLFKNIRAWCSFFGVDNF